jgi:hypothetical protein
MIAAIQAPIIVLSPSAMIRRSHAWRILPDGKRAAIERRNEDSDRDLPLQFASSSSDPAYRVRNSSALGTKSAWYWNTPPCPASG